MVECEFWLTMVGVRNMITKWKVGNFKSISEEKELELAPLTIFAGPNSSGKSSFIQSILMITQTIADSVDSRTMHLNGALTKLGQIDELCFNGRKSQEILVSFACRPLKISSYDYFTSKSENKYWFKEVSVEVSYVVGSSSNNNDSQKFHPRHISTNVNGIFKDDNGKEVIPYLKINRNRVTVNETDGFEGDANYSENILNSVVCDIDLDKYSLEDIKEYFNTATAVGCQFKHFLPKKLTSKIDIIEEISKFTSRILTGEKRAILKFPPLKDALGGFILPEKFLEFIKNAFNDAKIDFDKCIETFDSYNLNIEKNLYKFEYIIYFIDITYIHNDKIKKIFKKYENLPKFIYEIIEESISESSERIKLIESSLPEAISSSVRYIERFFQSSLKYLGPLRDPPKIAYENTTNVDSTDVGIHGELLAAVYELNKDKRIDYIKPESMNNSIVDIETVRSTLEQAINDWLNYLGVAKSLHSEELGKYGILMKVELSELAGKRGLTNVGLGVSQVLPVLVLGLLSEPDTTLLIEHPELHLHPKVQFLLGDFFLALALSKRQCIVETHSEYIIDRLRLRVAESPLDKEPLELSTIYFVENQKKGTSFRKLDINEFGTIPDWPDNFFDESQLESDKIFKAAMRKRELEERKNNEQM